MFGSHFHLSRPHLSFLAFLNFRTSWLSREIVFTVFFFLMTFFLWFTQWKTPEKIHQKTILGWIAITFGVINVYCMAHIYQLPTQTAWDTPATIFSFFSTMILLGIMVVVLLLVMDFRYSEMRGLSKIDTQRIILQKSLFWFVLASVIICGIIVGEILFQITKLIQSDNKSALISIQLLARLYPGLFGIRLGMMLAGVIGLMVAVYWQKHNEHQLGELLIPTYISCLFILVAEILGRFLFYATHVRIGI
jgi:anaerobic dimethyl sulfoxide reductase subunit C (anchor subunit)